MMQAFICQMAWPILRGLEQIHFEFAVEMPKNAGRNRESTGKRKVSVLVNSLLGYFLYLDQRIKTRFPFRGTNMRYNLSIVTKLG